MPLLVEDIDTINRQLKEHFGMESDGSPIWRVVWSEDQFEKRLMDTTDSGIQMLFPDVREAPKYRQWIRQKYVLERLCVVPEVNKKELLGINLSYEPTYVFQDDKDNYLPPKFVVAKFVIDAVYAAQGKKGMRKYVDEDTTPESKQARIEQLKSDLFGNETDATDALAYGSGVVVPHKQFGDEK